MAVVQIAMHWRYIWKNTPQTFDVNIPPSTVMATAVLHGKSGGGLAMAGIPGFRRRLSSGADEPINFGVWTNWPPAVFDRVSSITFGVALGANQSGYILARLDHWA